MTNGEFRSEITLNISEGLDLVNTLERVNNYLKGQDVTDHTMTLQLEVGKQIQRVINKFGFEP